MLWTSPGAATTGGYLLGSVRRAAGALAGDPDTAVNSAAGGLAAPEALDFAGRSPITLEAWASFAANIDNHRHIFNKDTDVPATGREQIGVYVHSTFGIASSDM